MSWIAIDEEQCNACGICITRCAAVFAKTDGKVTAKANEQTCNLCGHCVALCPTDAIVHHQMNMDNFVRYDKKVSFETRDFVQFIRERRSHRFFKNQPIPREDLETLVDVCRYAPTGSNVQNVEIILVQDRDKISQYANLTMDYFISRIESLKETLATLEARGQKDTPEWFEAARHLRYGTGFAPARKAGYDPIFYRAPAVMIFHSPMLTSMPAANGVIASTTVALTARTMGLETCYIGLCEMAANDYPPLAEALSLPAGHRVFSVIILGYPRLRYLRAVDRKPIAVRWE